MEKRLRELGGMDSSLQILEKELCLIVVPPPHITFLLNFHNHFYLIPWNLRRKKFSIFMGVDIIRHSPKLFFDPINSLKLIEGNLF